MQQSQTSSFVCPSSPTSNLALFDSAYSSFDYSSPSPTSFHFSSCPYSADPYCVAPPPPHYSPYTPSSFYSPVYHNPQSIVSSTPIQSSNVSLLPSTKNSVPAPTRRRQQQSNMSSTPSTAIRKRISDEAVDRLNAFYATNKRPTELEKDRLALECNITVAQVNTWFNNSRSRRGDTNPKVAQKQLRQQIDSLANQVAFLQQQQQSSSFGHF